jgi:hypothetical protein
MPRVSVVCNRNLRQLTPQQIETFLQFFPTEYHRRHVRRWLGHKGFYEFMVREHEKIFGFLQSIPSTRGQEQQEQVKDALAEMEVAFSLVEAGVQLREYHPKVGEKVPELLCGVQSKVFYVEVKRIRLSDNERKLDLLQKQIRTAVAQIESQYCLDVCLLPASWDCRELFQHADKITTRCVQIAMQEKQNDPRCDLVQPISVVIDGQKLAECFVSWLPDKEKKRNSLHLQRQSNSIQAGQLP